MIYILDSFDEFAKKQIEFKSNSEPWDIARKYERYVQYFVANYAHIFEREFSTVSEQFEKLYLNRAFTSVCESLKWCEKRDFATLVHYVSILVNAASILREAKEILKLQLSTNEYVYLAQKVTFIYNEIQTVSHTVVHELSRLHEYEQANGI